MVHRHYLDIAALDGKTLRGLLDAAHHMKAELKAAEARGGTFRDTAAHARLAGRVLALIFEKPSTRTRISFDVAMRQLGGETITLNKDDLQLGRGETISDTARVMSRYVDAIMLRALKHSTMEELASNAEVPVINGLTDQSHPCQILADLVTVEEALEKTISDCKIAWVGDGNNVARSFVHAAAKLGYEMRVATPASLALEDDLITSARNEGATLVITTDVNEAVSDADCVVTDTWVSMGDEDVEERIEALTPYRVDAALMKHAAPGAIFLHCLPAYRDQEVTGEVIDGPQSLVFDEAENRLHAQKAILAWCLGGD